MYFSMLKLSVAVSLLEKLRPVLLLSSTSNIGGTAGLDLHEMQNEITSIECIMKRFLFLIVLQNLFLRYIAKA
jgi:hypothetical protein